MKLSHNSKNAVLKKEQTEKVVLKYTKPHLVKLGTVTDMTAGAIGSAVDITAPSGGYPRQ